MSKKNTFILLLILGVAFWGISFPVTKLSIGSFSQSTFLFYRFAVAALAITFIFFKNLRSISLSSVKAGVTLALPLAFGIHFQTLGLVKHTSASECSFIAGMSVVLVPLLKLVLYKTKIDLKTWLAGFVALSGLFVISITKEITFSTANLYVLTGTLGFAFYLIKVEYLARERNIVSSLIPMFWTVAFIMLVISLFDSTANWFPAKNEFWLGIIYCGLFSTAYVYSVSNISQNYISAEKVALIYLFEPVFAAIASFFIMNEGFSLRLVVGGSLILAATVLSEIKFRKIDLEYPE